jgi:hypothetical protein
MIFQLLFYHGYTVIIDSVKQKESAPFPRRNKRSLTPKGVESIMSQTAEQTKTTEKPITVDERMAERDRWMVLPRKAPTLYKGIPID